MWTLEGSLPVHVTADAAPGSSDSVIVDTNFVGAELTFEDTTPPGLVRIEGLPDTNTSIGGSDRAIKLVVRDDGPWPLDQTGARYSKFSVLDPNGYRQRIWMRGGRTHWFQGAEVTIEATVWIPQGTGIKPMQFTIVDAVGNVTEKAVDVRVGPDVVKPRPLRPRVIGVMRVGTTATCTPVRGGSGGTGRTSVQWRRNARVIPRATRTTLRLTPSMLRSRITCTITVSNAAGSGAATSLPRIVAAARR